MSKYAHGKIYPGDEGEMHLAVYIKDDVVMIDFGKELTWIGLTKKELEPFIEVLKNNLEKL